MQNGFFSLSESQGVLILRLVSSDQTNLLSRDRILALTRLLSELSKHPMPLVIAGNQRFFSAGADLSEIQALNAPAALEFSRIGRELMNSLEKYAAPVYAAISGYCMGGGLDLALACHRRVAAPGAVFGHRGAALGLITGWGGTQRLPRIIGKSFALQMFICAASVDAARALEIGLVDSSAPDPVAEAVRRISIPNGGSHRRSTRRSGV